MLEASSYLETTCTTVYFNTNCIYSIETFASFSVSSSRLQFHSVSQFKMEA